MREIMNPGQGRTGAAEVSSKCENCLFHSKNFSKYQALCRLIFLQSLIGPTFEPELSLAIDRAILQMEAQKERQRGGLVHVGVVVLRVLADLARRQSARAGEGLCCE